MYKFFFKRIIDFMIALCASPFVLIICIFVWIAIKLDDGGPLFHMASRIGKGGKIFKMFKFRSMIVNAPDIRMPDGNTYNAEDDPRVTRVGRFIRKTSIDELPQIFNILLGHMSFIGPRPDSASYIDKYLPEEKIILTARPGITGWNQAVNRNSASAKEKIWNDMYYVEHFSFMLDMKIVILTIKSVLLQKNIYRN